MKSKLENFDIFICDKCCEVITIHDVFTLNQATSHSTKCVCNKGIMKRYNDELKAAKSDIELKLIHEKYINLL